MSGKPVFTTFEAAKLCHVSPLSIINWVNAGRLAAFRTPGGHRRIRREDLVLFMRDNGLPLPDELKQGSGRRKLLIVDDEIGVRKLLADHFTGLSKDQYEVATAGDGFEAGRLTATFRPDVVILDLLMPGFDGFEVCKTIKADPVSASTLVVVLTDPTTPEAAARILECGAARCFTKPVDPAEVSAFVETEITQQGGAKRRRGRPART